MRRLFVLLTLLGVVIAVGTAWYATFEHFSVVDALYQVIITLSTVGYGEVHPLDTSGRVFTIFLILGGIGIMASVATQLVEMVVVGELRERLGLVRSSRKVRRMADHFIVCGFGRVGEEIVRELRTRHAEVVVVELQPDRISRARELGCGTVQGDATEEPYLVEAGVQRARVLIAAADSDVGNTYIALTARTLNPNIFIVARAGSDAAEARLHSAGANRVVSPYRISGRRMALTAIQPMILDFVDYLAAHRDEGGDLLAEVVVREETDGLAGRTIAEAFRDDAIRILGLERADGQFLVGPGGAIRLAAGDRLMIYGQQTAIESLSGHPHTGPGAPAHV
jgi:voltage-gated potassium channel